VSAQASVRKRPETRWETCTIWTSVTLCQPAVRMLAIEACADDDPNWEQDFTIYPVVAVQSRVGLQFAIEVPWGSSPFQWPTAAKLIEHGWEFSRHVLEDKALIFNEEYGLIAADDEIIECSNTAVGTIVTPWPPSEDNEKLAPLKERLLAKARAKNSAA